MVMSMNPRGHLKRTGRGKRDDDWQKLDNLVSTVDTVSGITESASRKANL